MAEDLFVSGFDVTAPGRCLGQFWRQVAVEWLRRPTPDGVSPHAYRSRLKQLWWSWSTRGFLNYLSWRAAQEPHPCNIGMPEPTCTISNRAFGSVMREFQRGLHEHYDSAPCGDWAERLAADWQLLRETFNDAMEHSATARERRREKRRRRVGCTRPVVSQAPHWSLEVLKLTTGMTMEQVAALHRMHCPGSSVVDIRAVVREPAVWEGGGRAEAEAPQQHAAGRTAGERTAESGGGDPLAAEAGKVSAPLWTREVLQLTTGRTMEEVAAEQRRLNPGCQHLDLRDIVRGVDEKRPPSAADEAGKVSAPLWTREVLQLTTGRTVEEVAAEQRRHNPGCQHLDLREIVRCGGREVPSDSGDDSTDDGSSGTEESGGRPSLTAAGRRARDVALSALCETPAKGAKRRSAPRDAPPSVPHKKRRRQSSEPLDVRLGRLCLGPVEAP